MMGCAISQMLVLSHASPLEAMAITTRSALEQFAGISLSARQKQRVLHHVQIYPEITARSPADEREEPSQAIPVRDDVHILEADCRVHRRECLEKRLERIVRRMTGICINR